MEMKRPSLLYLQGREKDGGIIVRVGGGVVVAGRGEFEL
jgi:predicted PhzF superfamily epimerase YddE/YHI9